MLVDRFYGSRVSAERVNVTCKVPHVAPAEAGGAAAAVTAAAGGTAAGQEIVVSSALDLVDALGYLELYGASERLVGCGDGGGSAVVLLAANISISSGNVSGPWPLAGLVLASCNVTLQGTAAAAGKSKTVVVLDLHGLIGAIVLASDAVTLTLRALTLVNLDQASAPPSVRDCGC